ncbi:hypothetical protein [Pseudomonas huaxiensis]|uniref:hypothetical protein n=1 Tax=Pseudomonas huaxiensis TaxID=2213017 RepID=UPI000DA663EA|nr:hypothetical protein [Pseudomonas huaxiensis]
MSKSNEEVMVILANLIGTPYTPEVKARIIECTARTQVVASGGSGSGGHNPQGFGSGNTQQSALSEKVQDASRINVVCGSNGLISGFHFG